MLPRDLLRADNRCSRSRLLPSAASVKFPVATLGRQQCPPCANAPRMGGERSIHTQTSIDPFRDRCAHGEEPPPRSSARGVITERWNTPEQQPEALDALFDDSDRLLVARAAEGRVRVANRLVRHRCPRTNGTHAAISPSLRKFALTFRERPNSFCHPHSMRVSALTFRGWNAKFPPTLSEGTGDPPNPRALSRVWVARRSLDLCRVSV